MWGRARSGRSVHGQKAGPPTAGRTRPDARAGERGHGAGRARRGQFAERTAGIVDRHRHAGRDVRGGLAVRRHLLHAHADGRPRRIRIGGGGHRDRQARERAGGHHSPENRRARDVGPDAGADGDDRGGARARAGCAGECVSVSRRTEQPVQHHPAMGARRRLAGDDRAAARTRRCGRGWKTKSTTASPAPTGTTTTRRPAVGKACCWFRSRIRSTSSSKASA